jgi:hypothetical protein
MRSKIHLISFLPVGGPFAPKDAASKLSSNAYLKFNEDPPRCQICEKKLVPIFQIYLGGGYFQFLYCASPACKQFGTVNNPKADNYLARIIGEAPNHRIYQGAFGIDAKDIYIREDEEDSASPNPDSKIGGEPAWLSAERYSICPYCKSAINMKFFMQIAIPEMQRLPFSAGSMLYFSRCMAHKDRFGFVWQDKEG